LAACPQCGRKLQTAPNENPFCPECRLVSESPAQRQPRISEYLRRFPATTVFLAINILVFLAMWINHVSPTSPTADQLIRWGACSGDEILSHNQWWRIITSAFVHIGAPHLIMNMWALWLMGTLAEAVLGSYLYAGVYLLCAIAGSLTSLFWNPLRVEAGASGALMGILGVLLSVLTFARLPVPKDVLRSTTRSLVQGAVLTLAIGLLPRIDNAAHVGGLICGLAVGFLLSLTRRADYTVQRPLRQVCLLVPLVLMVPLALAAKRRGEPWMHYQHALEHLQNGQYSQAEQESRAALSRLPQNSRVLELLSLALFYEGNDAEAGKYLRDLSAREPRNSFATNTLAMIELKENDFVGARDLLLKALPLQPRNADGQVYLGRALQALDQDNDAITQYRAAIQINPNLYEAEMALGSIYEKHKKPQDAILFYGRAAQLQPAQLEPLRGLARAYRAAGMKTQADQAAAEIEKREQGAGKSAPTAANR
jgi:membrane associated rhomboid family serine protease/Flp pilus assembly protein TadD